MNTEQPSSAPFPKTVTPSSVNNKMLGGLLALISFFVGTLVGFSLYPVLQKDKMPTSYQNSRSMIESFAPRSTPSSYSMASDAPLVVASSSPKKASEAPFCKNYGTYEVKKSDLLTQYTVGVGETMRDIAQKKLGGETKALDIISVNPELSSYEIDDELPIRTKLYLPNDTYVAEDISSYAKSSGNVRFNPTKPMFGVDAPNSATGPFIQTDSVKRTMAKIHEGDCVTVIYGSRGYGTELVVFEVIAQ